MSTSRNLYLLVTGTIYLSYLACSFLDRRTLDTPLDTPLTRLRLLALWRLYAGGLSLCFHHWKLFPTRQLAADPTLIRC